MVKFRTMRLGSLLMAVVAAVLVVTLSPSAATAGSSAAGAKALQRQIDAQLAKTQGGVQISDNAVAYNNGNVIVVFPNPGEKKAPAGIGANVRDTSLAKTASAQTPAAVQLQDCPDGFTAHWYCFYTDVNWGGRRLQFKDTCVGRASDWGFDNETSSWVNNNGGAYEYTYDGSGLNGAFLWSMPSGPTQSSWVGGTNNDRMSSWAKHGDGCA